MKPSFFLSRLTLLCISSLLTVHTALPVTRAAPHSPPGSGLFVKRVFSSEGWRPPHPPWEPFLSDLFVLENTYDVAVGGYSNLQVHMRATQDAYQPATWYQVLFPLTPHRLTPAIVQLAAWRIPAHSSLSLKLSLVGHMLRCRCEQERAPDMWTPAILLFDGRAQREDTRRTTVFIHQSVSWHWDTDLPPPPYESLVVSPDCFLIGSGSLENAH